MLKYKDVERLLEVYGFSCSEELIKKIIKIYSLEKDRSLEAEGEGNFIFPVSNIQDIDTVAWFMNLKVEDDGTVESVFDLRDCNYPSEEAFTWMLRMSGNLFITDDRNSNYWVLDLEDPKQRLSYWYHADQFLTAYHVISLDEVLELLEAGDDTFKFDYMKDINHKANCIFDIMKEIIDVAWEDNPDYVKEIFDKYKNCKNTERLENYLRKEKLLI